MLNFWKILFLKICPQETNSRFGMMDAVSRTIQWMPSRVEGALYHTIPDRRNFVPDREDRRRVVVVVCQRSARGWRGYYILDWVGLKTPPQTELFIFIWKLSNGIYLSENRTLAVLCSMLCVTMGLKVSRIRGMQMQRLTKAVGESRELEAVTKMVLLICRFIPWEGRRASTFFIRQYCQDCLRKNIHRKTTRGV